MWIEPHDRLLIQVYELLYLHAHEVFVEVYFNINVLTWCMDCSGRSKYVVLHVPLRIYVIYRYDLLLY